MNQERQQETFRLEGKIQEILYEDHEPKKKHKEKSSPLDVAEYTTIAVIVNAIMGTLFYMFSTNIDNYESSQCISLRVWGIGYAVYCISVVFVRIFIFLPVYCSMQNKESNKMKFWFRCLIVYQSIEVLISFIFLFGLTVTYFFNEPCGNLRELTQVYLIILYSIISLLICMACGLAVFIKNACAGRTTIDDEDYI